ncbi:probable beta-D-xylosidase 7 [Aristolochia californica]|uniref:probable beta-D-xylosidase 7 n=1 Tax=Aristolochia californica TaxID=171875 RepID=UPI0035DB7CD9
MDSEMRVHHHLPLLLFCFMIFSCSASSTLPPFACDASHPLTHSLGFCETSLPISHRVGDLISRLTIDEKISQLVVKAPAIARLGIPSYNWWSEALHGIAIMEGGVQFVGDEIEYGLYGVLFNGTIRSATSFPQVILTAASFNPLLWYRIGEAIGTEARGIYNTGQSTGLTFWAPNINIFRDPRWGRGQETPGEDPLVASKYAVSYVRGVQGDSFYGEKSTDGPDHLKASACCKHFTAYDLDNWKNVSRFTFDAKVSLQDLADTYQPPFKSCVEEGRASGIMCSYNKVNGVPTCADFNLLSRTARQKWHFNGYIVSDCDAVAVMYSHHHYSKTPEDAVGSALGAGMDIDCATFLLKYTKSALQRKKLSESDIDRALRNLFSVRMRLGLFNGNNKYLLFGKIGSNQVCSKKHQDLALEAARDGIVLLKNSAKLLPLSHIKTGSLAVIGPNAKTTETLLGNYQGPPCKRISILQALQSYVEDTQYSSGCDEVACKSLDSIDKAVKIAKGTDYVVLIMGLDQTEEAEGHDRLDLILPGQQQTLITRVAKAAKKPVILVLLSGGPLDISFAKRDSNIGSILWAGYPGESGGLAIADVIFGRHNPGGRLPVTWYPQKYTRIPMTDMRMRSDPASDYPGRTYRFYHGQTVFKFGYGLSYSAYSYEFTSVAQNSLFLNRSDIIKASKHSNPSSALYRTEVMGVEFCESLKFSAVVAVQNHGEMAGRHPVLLFVRASDAKPGAASKQLVGFESVHLNVGERAKIEFAVKPCDHLSRTDESGSKVIESGSHFLLAGDAEYKVNVIG